MIRDAKNKLLRAQFRRLPRLTVELRLALLAGQEPAVIERRGQFIDRPAIGLEITFARLGQHHAHDVMEIIRPHSIEAQPALFLRTEQRRFVAFILRDDKCP